jgi:cytochrome c-type biogenesis protein CcmH/NrfG
MQIGIGKNRESLESFIWKGRPSRANRFGWLTIPSWERVAVCALAIALSTGPLRAQKGGAPRGGSGGGRGSGAGSSGGSTRGTTTNAPSGSPGYSVGQPSMQPGMQPRPLVSAMAPLPKPTIVEDESCLPWTVSEVRGASVSVMRLGVPSKARGEYEKACSAFKKNKWADAEQHVRKALDKSSNYVAAWVMLGQVLEEQQRRNEAQDACSRATTIDPTYLPPYLCSAELSARDEQWDRVLNLANLALGLNPVGDGYAYYYRATAYFHMSKIQDAQKSAVEAAEIDREHHHVALYFLLAQIYDAEGDAVNAAAQLREFLKLNNDREQSAAAKQYLAKLEGQQATKEQPTK